MITYTVQEIVDMFHRTNTRPQRRKIEAEDCGCILNAIWKDCGRPNLDSDYYATHHAYALGYFLFGSDGLWAMINGFDGALPDCHGERQPEMYVLGQDVAKALGL